jgi:hypothetical protein
MPAHTAPMNMRQLLRRGRRSLCRPKRDLMGVDGANPDEVPPLQMAPPPEFEKMKEIATSHAHKLCLGQQ